MTTSRPLVSLIIPCYNVERYLPALITSIDRQLTDDVEVILVDDGSTDGTAAIAHRWAGDSTHRITVVEQPNEGPAQARNTGLDHASGEWVSFPDGDDVLGKNYLSAVIGFLRSPGASTATIIATNLRVLDHATGSVADIHPLRGKFARGERVISLAREPQTIQLHANSTFFRHEDIQAGRHRFDQRVRPNFEDSAFVASVLLSSSDPRIAVVPRARYLYRTRGDLSSLTSGSWSDPAKYDDVLRYGYLPLLQNAQRHGGVPLWLQYLLVYELSWYFRMDIQIHSATALLDPPGAEVFFKLAAASLASVEPAAIQDFGASYLSAEIRAVLLALKCELPSPPVIRYTRTDREQLLTGIAYYEPANAPAHEVEFAVDGTPVSPVFLKRRGVTYFGREVVTEVIAWLPGIGPVTTMIDGAVVNPRRAESESVLRQYSPHRNPLRRLFDAAKIGLQLLHHDRARLLQLIVQLDLSILSKGNGPARLVRVVPGAAKYRDCWLLMDRDDQAHDNAEHLYRYLRYAHPEINAWFVLNRSSPDWDRLKAEGFRLIEHNSASHAFALVHCRELVSSQIDHYVVSPPIVFWLRPHPWRFTWLQHGITKDDLSRWVNPKPVSTVIAATAQEYESFVSDGTPYVWTARETALTGFPRHDALLGRAATVPEHQRRAIVFMPTWRRELLGDGVSTGNGRVSKDGFWQSDYIRNWFGLIGSSEVRAAAAEAGLDLVFMPHPNMGPHLSPDRIPAGVRLLDYVDSDVQDVLARASHVITDYSSNAFEAAIIERPVLYFQFDRGDFFNGEHAYRRGYYDYMADGFGPVCTTLETATAEIVRLIEAGLKPAEPYASRIRAAFPARDGQSCERVFRAILARRHPLAASK
jgi:glycosyltransferase involved in cell wall biosynthesis/CDP-glycerol glycerophosphotransferase (TagB/SpsB family)